MLTKIKGNDVIVELLESTPFKLFLFSQLKNEIHFHQSISFLSQHSFVLKASDFPEFDDPVERPVPIDSNPLNTDDSPNRFQTNKEPASMINHLPSRKTTIMKSLTRVSIQGKGPTFMVLQSLNLLIPSKFSFHLLAANECTLKPTLMARTRSCTENLMFMDFQKTAI